MPALGDEFRAAREARGLSLSDVAEQIHIRATYLEAIEEEDWPAIGAPVYIRGFIRTYARFLGIDPEHAVEEFNQAVPSPPPTKQFGAATAAAAGLSGTRRPGPSIWVWLGGAVALALVAYVGYGYYQLKVGAPQVALASASPQASATADASAQPPPEATTPADQAETTPAPTATRQAVSLRFTQVSWLRATVDGNVVVEGEFPAGTIRDFHGKHIHLLVGNAGGVVVTAPNAPPKAMGAPGEVVERDYVLGKQKTLQ